MRRVWTATKWLVIGVALIGCSHGYAVTLRTSRLDAVDPVVIAQIGDAASARGLATGMVAHRNDDSPDKSLTSSFHKQVSERWHGNDAIHMNVVYSDQRSSDQWVVVFIENFWSGMEPPIKQQIDALAADCYELLAKAFGPNKVTVETGPAQRPW
jgi:hypothetical protein